MDQDEWAAGFDWVIELLRAHECSAIANEVELCKAEEFLARKNFDGAITLFKGFERKDNALKARAATNLSFLYFLEREYATADRYASKAMQHARYSAKALVNKGNCFFVNNELERAKEMFLEAIGVEADCVEAIFNLGLVNKRLEAYAEAMQAFDKLHTILPENPEAVCVARSFSIALVSASAPARASCVASPLWWAVRARAPTLPPRSRAPSASLSLSSSLPLAPIARLSP